MLPDRSTHLTCVSAAGWIAVAPRTWQGITHLNAKGDGRCFISNCKDQTIKLWDVRMGVRSEQQAAAAGTQRIATWDWDYRCVLFRTPPNPTSSPPLRRP